MQNDNVYFSLLGIDGTEILNEICGSAVRPRMADLRKTGTLTHAAKSMEPIAWAAIYDAPGGGEPMLIRKISNRGKVRVPVIGEPVVVNIDLLFDNVEEHTVFYMGFWCGDPESDPDAYEISQQGGRAELVPLLSGPGTLTNVVRIPISLEIENQVTVTHMGLHIWKYGNSGLLKACPVTQTLLPGDPRQCANGIIITRARGDVLSFDKGAVSLSLI